MRYGEMDGMIEHDPTCCHRLLARLHLRQPRVWYASLAQSSILFHCSFSVLLHLRMRARRITRNTIYRQIAYNYKSGGYLHACNSTHHTSSHRPPLRFPPLPPPFPAPAPGSTLPCVPRPVVSFGACFRLFPAALDP